MTRYFTLPILLLLACGGRELPDRKPDTPVILISIDTLRSDHLPAYGYTGVETPNIDALRRDALLFKRAYSHCPLTLPSHATVFTGGLPAETGIRDNIGYTLTPGSATLAELLRGKGYATGAAISSYVLRKGSGIERGFESYDDHVGTESSDATISSLQREGGASETVAATWLKANSNRPVFYFLHLYEPHSPYAAPEPYRSRYSPYDAEIAKSDEIVGQFLKHLKELEIYDRALVILFSDHGEGLNDHGEEEHGIFLYREAIQVPLLVKLPGGERAGEAVDSPVQLSDIFPTVVEQTGVTLPSPPTRSASAARSLLAPVADGDRPIYSETYFPRFHFGWSDLHSLVSDRFHFIQAPEMELYSTADVSEKDNILEENRRVLAAMRQQIAPLIRAADAPKPIDPEEAAKLAALGYLGSTSSHEGPLPDPKTKTKTFREIREGFRLFRAGRYEEALSFYQRLLRENPRMLDLWDISARALVQLGRPEEAIAAAKEALKLSPQSTHLAVLVANLSMEVGRVEDAQRHAELSVHSDPVQGHDLLARIALARGDADVAEREARASLAGNGTHAPALMTLGAIAKHRQNYAAALTHLDAAASAAREKKSGLAGLNHMRGDVLARLGRGREAEQAFREEIRLFPANPASYTSLILFYVAEGRAEDATRLVHDLEKASPTARSYAAISETLRVVGDDRGARFWAKRGLSRFPDDKTLQKLTSVR